MRINEFDNIIEQIKIYLPQYLEEKGIDSSKNFRCLFPEHEDNSPSCSLAKDKKRFHCYGCSRYGDIFDAVQILENKPRVGLEWLQDTLKYLANKYNIEISNYNLSEDDIYQLDIYKAYKTASQLLKSRDIKDNRYFRSELEKRKWDPNILENYSVGTVSSYSDFYEELLNRGFKSEFLEEIELCRKDIFNPNNIIFTWKDSKGRPVGFTSRNLLFEEQNKSKQNPKYNNIRTSGLRFNIFQKNKRLFGIDTAILEQGSLYIFEGQADVITARHHGIKKCVALAGSNMSPDHVYVLKKMGLTDIIICLDGDSVGREKTQQILEEKLAGNRDLRVRVIELPENNDPDSFIREFGIKAFKDLACWSAFEWRLNQYSEDSDFEQLAKQMIPFIVNESSPITRDQLCKTLAKRTGITLKAVRDELNIYLDQKEYNKFKEQQNVIDKVINSLRNKPSEAASILQEGQIDLFDLTKKHDADNLSSEDFVRQLDEQKNKQESAELNDVGFNLGKNFKELEEILRGCWSEGVFMCIGGAPNTGKSAMLSKLAYEIALNNEDVCVIYHTIDDTSEQLTPRFVAIAEGSHRLTINMVRYPKYWGPTAGDWILDKRDQGYKILRDLAQKGRLVIKDLSHGSDLPFTESLINYYQDKYSDRRIVYILDNFHKLRDYESKDERVRFKQISEKVKSISIRKKCCIMCSVEYHKMPPGIKPTNNNVAETNQIFYDANFLAHLYNELSDMPSSYTVCHIDVDWQDNKKVLPRIEFIIGKNKITEIKDTLFFDFFPASSDFKYVNRETVALDSQRMKEKRKQMAEQQKDELLEVFG